MIAIVKFFVKFCCFLHWGFSGFHTLMEIMSKLGSKKVEQSPLNHNERLEFLGDAVIEFITTIHLFFMFTELDEGGLATYRSTMVQNKNLAVLAKVDFKLHCRYYKNFEFNLYQDIQGLSGKSSENRSGRIYALCSWTRSLP